MVTPAYSKFSSKGLWSVYGAPIKEWPEWKVLYWRDTTRDKVFRDKLEVELVRRKLMGET